MTLEKNNEVTENIESTENIEVNENADNIVAEEKKETRIRYDQ